MNLAPANLMFGLDLGILVIICSFDMSSGKQFL